MAILILLVLKLALSFVRKNKYCRAWWKCEYFLFCDSINNATMDGNTLTAFVQKYKYCHAQQQHFYFLLCESTSIATLDGNTSTFILSYQYSRIDVDTILQAHWIDAAISISIRCGCIDIELLIQPYRFINIDTIRLHWYRGISIQPYQCQYSYIDTAALMYQYRYQCDTVAPISIYRYSCIDINTIAASISSYWYSRIDVDTIRYDSITAA